MAPIGNEGGEMELSIFILVLYYKDMDMHTIIKNVIDLKGSATNGQN